jgi:probable phosphoglycerate mutase
MDYGAWQFKTFQDAKKDDPALFATWLTAPHLVRFPDGESLQDLAARCANALRFVLAHHPDDTVVLVGHDSLNRALLLQCLDLALPAFWRLAQAPCCLNEIDIGAENVCIVRINETHHLDAIAASE